MSQTSEVREAPLDLNQDDLTWLMWQIWSSKRKAAFDMLVKKSETGQAPFFELRKKGKDSRQSRELTWPSLEQDAWIFRRFLTTLNSDIHSGANQSHQPLKITSLLKLSPLFAALQSPSIIPSKDQVAPDGRSISPFLHTRLVAMNMAEISRPEFQDRLVAHLTAWTHDIGKMAAVNFLPADAQDNVETLRQDLIARYGENSGKHTHPKHAFTGVLILHQLLNHVRKLVFRSKQTDRKAVEKKFFPSKLENQSDQVALLLNVVFHHHHFLYTGEMDHHAVKSWLWHEVETKLLHTLPDNRPDLVIRFLALLFQLRLADIKATKTHHRHWQTNMAWIEQTPGILEENLSRNDQGQTALENLRQVINHLSQITLHKLKSRYDL